MDCAERASRSAILGCVGRRLNLDSSKKALVYGIAAAVTLAVLAWVAGRDGRDTEAHGPAHGTDRAPQAKHDDRQFVSPIDAPRSAPTREASAHGSEADLDRLVDSVSALFSPEEDGPSIAPDDIDHALVGSVLAFDGRPVEGAHVTAFSREFGAFGRSSEGDGSFEIPVKGADTYDVAILVPIEGHVSPPSVSVRVEGRTPILLRTLQAERSVRGTLRDTASGTPMPDVLIEAFHQGDRVAAADGSYYFKRGPLIRSTRTDGDGRYVIENLPSRRIGLLPGKGVFRLNDPHCPLGAPATTTSVDLATSDAVVDLAAVAAEWVVLTVEMTDAMAPVSRVYAKYERMESAPGIGDRAMPRSDDFSLNEDGLYELRIGPRLPINQEVQVRVVIEEGANAIRDLTVVHGEVIHLRI